MKVVNKLDFKPSEGFESKGITLTEQVGYRSVQQQIEAFLMANDNLIRYRYKQDYSMKMDDVILDDCEDIVDVKRKQDELMNRVKAKQQQAYEQQLKQQNEKKAEEITE